MKKQVYSIQAYVDKETYEWFMLEKEKLTRSVSFIASRLLEKSIRATKEVGK